MILYHYFNGMRSFTIISLSWLTNFLFIIPSIGLPFLMHQCSAGMNSNFYVRSQSHPSLSSFVVVRTIPQLILTAIGFSNTHYRPFVYTVYCKESTSPRTSGTIPLDIAYSCMRHSFENACVNTFDEKVERKHTFEVTSQDGNAKNENNRNRWYTPTVWIQYP